MNPAQMDAKKDYKYAATTVNVRKRPTVKSKIVVQVYWNDCVRVIRRLDLEWYIIWYQGEIRYICGKYLKNNQTKGRLYHVPSQTAFKSYEDADCITDSIQLEQGRLKKEYHLDYETGVWMVGDRYCVAVGSYYVKKVNVKIDLVLQNDGNQHILKCITADVKSDRDTIDKHRVHKDGSVAEFVVRTSSLSSNVTHTGDVSYAGKQFRGKIVKIKVYKEI